MIYELNSIIICLLLLALMLAALWACMKLGRKRRKLETEEIKSQNISVQASIVGMLALLLGFTFSMSLQRYDDRSKAVVAEANAIGTAALRAASLPAESCTAATAALQAWLDLRIEAGRIDLASDDERQAVLARTQLQQAALWDIAIAAIAADDRPATSGLFVQAVNDVFDQYSNRVSIVDRHVPEIIMVLLFSTFIFLGGIVGYSAGLSSSRPPASIYAMLSLIVVLVFIILDLDRPRRGMVEVSQQSLIDTKALLREECGR